MKRFVGLLLCLSLTIFTVARAMKPDHTLAAITKTAQKKPTGEKADAKTYSTMSQAEENEVAAEEDTDEEVTSADDDNMEDASDDQGEDMSDDGGGGDDGGADDSSDDGGGDDGD
jgi:hypothetical protein